MGEGEVAYVYTETTTGIESEEAPVNAGEYEVCATVAETKNYNEGETCADFAINKREVTVIMKGETGIFTYDGLEKSVGGYTAKISDELYAKEGKYLGDEETFKPLSAVEIGTYVDDVTAKNFINNTRRNFDVTFEVTPSVLIIEEPAVVTPTIPVANPETGVLLLLMKR